MTLGRLIAKRVTKHDATSFQDQGVKKLAVRYEQNSSGIRIFQDMTTRRAWATATSNGEFDSQLMLGQ